MMKRKTFAKRLFLSKETIANLNQDHLFGVKAGYVQPIEDKETAAETCVTRCTLCAPTNYPYCDEYAYAEKDVYALDVAL